jgi:hypothetical protein
MFQTQYNKVQDTKRTVVVQCIQIENQNIKNAIMQVLHGWKLSSKQRIKYICLKQLKGLHDRFQTAAFDLGTPIVSLQSLKKNRDLLEDAKNSIPVIEKQIGPLHEKFRQIDENLKDEDRNLKDNLDDAFASFKTMLVQKEQKQKEQHKIFYRKTLNEL